MRSEPVQGPPSAPERGPKGISVGGAAFLGIGAMVGAGIFALLGEAGAVAGSAVWISFLLGGIIALLLGYTVAKLGVRFPSSGGLVTYLMQGFGNGHVTGVASWLFYFAGLIVTAMVAVSFGTYAAELFIGSDASMAWVKLLASLVVVAMVAINIVGAGAVAKVQGAIVVILLLVFAVFIAVTLADIDFDLLARSTYPSVMDIIASVALTFFAYLGFAVVSFTAGDMRDPGRQLPRAMYLSLVVTVAVYVLISLGVFGTLTSDEVQKYGDTALAYAAKPALGDAGFTMMALAALLATSSSVNANVYAAGGITSKLALERQFPRFFGGRSRLGGDRGLIVSAVAVLVLANMFDLSAIASIGSAVALAIFMLVAIAALKVRSETGSNPLLILLAIGATAVVLALFTIDTLRNEPQTFAAMLVVGALAVALDLVWKWIRDRRPPEPAPAAG